MRDLEDVVRRTFSAHEPEVPSADCLLANVHAASRGRAGRKWLVRLSASALTVSLVVAVMTDGFGLGGPEPAPPPPPSAGSSQVLIEQLRGPASTVRWAPQPFATLSDLLPTSTHYDAEGDDVPAAPVVEAILVGEIVEVQPGYGFPASVPDDGHDYRMDFASAEADWSTVTLTVEVDEVVSTADGVDIGDSVQVGMAVFPARGTSERWQYDTDAIFDSLKESGRTLFVLDQNAGSVTLYPHDGELYDLFMAGEWWAPIGAAGTISLPVGDNGQEEIWLSDADTLSELRDDASEPLKVVEVSDAEATWLIKD